MKQTPRRSNRRIGWRQTGILAALAVVLVLGLAACYPGGPESTGDLGVVVTMKNPNGNFADMMTYAMEDTVVELKKPDDDSSEAIDTQFNDTILETLNAEMVAAGFTREMDPESNKPDVWLSVGAVESEVWVYWYSWGYWGGYPGWGGYYPPYYSATSYQQGTVIWQLHDLRGIEDPTDPDAEPPLNWTGALNGALANSANTTHSGIQSGIKQGFAQSPYIVGHSAGK